MSREEGNKKEDQMQLVQRLWALRQDLPDAYGWRRWRNSNSKEEVVICPFQFYFVSGPITHVAILWNVEKGNLLKTTQEEEVPKKEEDTKEEEDPQEEEDPNQEKTEAS